MTSRPTARCGSSGRTVPSTRSRRRSATGSVGPSSTRIRGSTRPGTRCSRIAPQRVRTLYRESIGPLGDPRAALAALADERIDVTAIDAYWWWLFERHDPIAASFRVIGETAICADAAAHLRAGARPLAGAAARRCARGCQSGAKCGCPSRRARHPAFRSGCARRLRSACRARSRRARSRISAAGVGETPEWGQDR